MASPACNIEPSAPAEDPVDALLQELWREVDQVDIPYSLYPEHSVHKLEQLFLALLDLMQDAEDGEPH